MIFFGSGTEWGLKDEFWNQYDQSSPALESTCKSKGRFLLIMFVKKIALQILCST